MPMTGRGARDGEQLKKSPESEKKSMFRREAARHELM